MFYKTIALASTLLVTSAGVNAALITNLYNLDINGTNYDVTFHTGASDTFNALWDADSDGVFGGPGSLFDAAPTFWGDETGAIAAANAIELALGVGDWTSPGTLSDSFLIPYKLAFGGVLTAGIDSINVAMDQSTTWASDTTVAGIVDDNASYITTNPYATFSVSAVPIPAAVWLFGSGLLGLIGVARRKVRV